MAQVTLRRRYDLECAHQLHGGLPDGHRCLRPHGHRYEVELHVQGLPDEYGVLIEYEGRLSDGTVFDSSAGRGPTPMIAGQVIPGFAQALTQMQKGGNYKIHIPSDLAYGPNPQPGSPIPPNADLDFDVTVVQVVPNAASMMGGQPN